MLSWWIAISATNTAVAATVATATTIDIAEAGPVSIAPTISYTVSKAIPCGMSSGAVDFRRVRVAYGYCFSKLFGEISGNGPCVRIVAREYAYEFVHHAPTSTVASCS